MPDLEPKSAANKTLDAIKLAEQPWTLQRRTAKLFLNRPCL
jgi:hypothetical protein